MNTDKEERYAVLNFSKLGYRYFRILFNVKVEDKSNILRELTEHPNICWVLEGKGWANLGVGIWAEDNLAINNIGEQIRKIVGSDTEIVSQSELTSLFSFTETDTGNRKNICMLDAAISKVQLSSTEMDYLKLVSLDSTLPDDELTKLLNIDLQELGRMKSKLEMEGVIAGYQATMTKDGFYFKIFADSNTTYKSSLFYRASRRRFGEGLLPYRYPAN